MWDISSLMADTILPGDNPNISLSSLSPAARVQRRQTHECDQCTKIYSRRSHLVDHRMTHTGERPYTCPICKQKFTRKDVLTRHMKTHSDERPYRCKNCHKDFKRKDHLTKHIRRHHQEGIGGNNNDKGEKVGIGREISNTVYDVTQHRWSKNTDRPPMLGECSLV